VGQRHCSSWQQALVKARWLTFLSSPSSQGLEDSADPPHLSDQVLVVAPEMFAMLFSSTAEVEYRSLTPYCWLSMDCLIMGLIITLPIASLSLFATSSIFLLPIFVIFLSPHVQFLPFAFVLFPSPYPIATFSILPLAISSSMSLYIVLAPVPHSFSEIQSLEPDFIVPCSEFLFQCWPSSQKMTTKTMVTLVLLV